MKKFFTIYFILLFIEIGYIFFLYHVIFRFDIPAPVNPGYVFFFLLFLAILYASFQKLPFHFIFRFILYTTTLLVCGFMFDYIIPKSWYTLKMPIFNVQKVTHATNMEGIRYFDYFTRRKMEEKYYSPAWEWAPTPDGFELSPHDADRIYSTIDWERLSYGSSYRIYFDTHCYYMSSSIKINTQYDSLVENTTQINGKNGQIFNRTLNQWENWGYIHLNLYEIKELDVAGKTRSEVFNIFGRPYDIMTNEITRTISVWDESQYLFDHKNEPVLFHKDSELLLYLCRDATFVVSFEGQHVNAILADFFNHP